MMKATLVAFIMVLGRFSKGSLIVARAQKQNTLHVMHAQGCAEMKQM